LDIEIGNKKIGTCFTFAVVLRGQLEDINKLIDFLKEIFQLRRFIGGKLSGYVIFRKTRPHNCVFYHVHMEGIVKILENNNMLELFKNRLGLLGLLPSIAPKTTLSQFVQKDDFGVNDYVKESPKKFKEKYGKTLNQDFFNQYFQMNYGEDTEKIYKDLVVSGFLDFVTKDEFRDYIKKAKERGQTNESY
jgi:hypothetical protein